MTTTFVPNGSASPPRMEVTIATPDGSNLTAATLWRRVSGTNTVTRVQPSTGVPSRYVEDYEAPWDTPVQYVATYTYAGGTVTETAPAQSLTPDVPAIWLIHPTIPALSMAIDVGSFSSIGLASIGTTTRRALATQHAILGNALPLLTKQGNRQAPASQLQLRSVTELEKLKLLALANDETPLLLRQPAGLAWGIEEGYYAIGDLGEDRILQYGPEPGRTLALPINRVQPPAGTVQSSWSWGGLMAGYADWGSVAAAYADWNAVTGNNPS